ncbi:hypothetical protein P0F09_003205 [Vibrio metschnikovii]|uniref:Transcriptional regulator VspR n=1 Tax=bacterium 19MO02SH05 TaxID=2920696 RepID=A0AAU6THP0_UNCXX|nr:hypothetical protein [Vibrio metschnikovii]EKO3569966.1 hypothetical protein [Vibrio metschnikovii]EKO3604685.1 hypothetical protein [Vibrio metschnikovii]EKO3895405.1 hypothetical protein [Vibrio metschnikovii]EKQ5812023.1 hypothetical protein [Vibrio metschnikovii]EKQ5812467.1 hypothetical protein [Vibrio metschnikovii]
MNRSQKMNALMYQLLFEKKMDNFSVVEIRDALLSLKGVEQDPQEGRKFIYRQILLLEKKGWLSSEGEGKKKKYFQTKLLKSLDIISRECSSSKILISQSSTSVRDRYSVLMIERGEYQGELEIILGEIEEYQSLIQRFPELSSQIKPLLKLARERSALLLGKINVLTNVLMSLSERSGRC